MSVDISDFEFLEPGHVFVRSDGRESRFLFLTNTALPPKFKKNHPPQVVYADEKNNILSCSIERFLAERKFVNVDPDLEARLNNLLALGSSSNQHVSDEDSLDLDDELLVTNDDGDEGGEEEEFEAGGNDNELGRIITGVPEEDEREIDLSAEEVDPTDPRDEDGTPIVTFVPLSDRPAAIDPLYLARAVSSYQETPNLTDGSLQHVLFIRADKGITKDTLYHAFSPTTDNPNTAFAFKVMIEGKEVLIDWDNFAGVYSCVFYGTEMYQVIFTVEAATRLAAFEANDEAEEAPQGVPVEAPVPAPEPVAAAPIAVAPAPVQVAAAPQVAAVQVAPAPAVQVAAQ